ncbi:hypothetical protein [Streptomyces sp. NPDC056670]|uniref:hypothetical protein n=1 Tax=Streptomyces sp. NPDC056670 TaxID=3345904 RepID=UPI003685FC69
MDLHAWITEQVDRVEQSIEEDCIPSDEAVPILRRCESDRRILARHRLDPNVTYEPACEGCGTYDDMGLPNVDNLNECPELLDLAHAHGITGNILAGLDRPQPPTRKPERGRLTLASLLATSDAPAALRGPNWKPYPTGARAHGTRQRQVQEGAA